MSAPFSTSRRAFVQGAAWTGSAVAAGALGSVALLARGANALAVGVSGMAHAPLATPPAAHASIVAFHLDQLYLDTSGTAEPYRPPAGLRSAQPLAELDEEQFHICFCRA